MAFLLPALPRPGCVSHFYTTLFQRIHVVGYGQDRLRFDRQSTHLERGSMNRNDPVQPLIVRCLSSWHALAGQSGHVLAKHEPELYLAVSDAWEAALRLRAKHTARQVSQTAAQQ